MRSLQLLIIINKLLPLQNAVFVAELFSAYILSIDLKKRIKAEKTPEDKATCFLDDKIYLDISKGDFKSFDALLNIMKKKDFRNLHTLAEKITAALVVEAEVSRNNSEGEIAVTSPSGLMVASLDSSKFISYASHKVVVTYMSFMKHFYFTALNNL